MIKTLSVREAREQFSRILARFDHGDSTPVGVGAHRKTKVVMVSVEYFEHAEKLIAAERMHAVQEAAASVRAEGLTVDPDAETIAERWAQGGLTTEQMRESVRRLYGVK